ncbi:MAG: nucleotidyltransferase domain-containing protein [Aquificae bacterium]|nr:nucleotidyltransferase domain-containing protein [Aquificota bacterium]
MDTLKAFTKQDYMNFIGKAIDKALKRESYIIFFGSVLSERFNTSSDIDVAVFCRNKLSAKDFMDIETPVLRDIDVVDLRSLSDKDFLGKIIKEGFIWKSSSELTQDFQELLKNLEK